MWLLRDALVWLVDMHVRQNVVDSVGCDFMLASRTDCRLRG
jgi:hypothetical protein